MPSQRRKNRLCLIALAMAVVTAFSTLHTGPAMAGDSESLQEIADHVRKVQEEPEKYLQGFNPDSSRATEKHRDWMQRHQNRARSSVIDFMETESGPVASAEQPDQGTGQHLMVFASFSLGDAELRTLAESIAHSGLPGIIVFRGIGDGERINDFIVRVNPILQNLPGEVESTIDPTEFDDHKVTTVPHMQIRGEDDQVLIEAAGLINPRPLIERLKSGDAGRLTKQGPTKEISERHLIEVMQERFAQIDWGERQRESLDSYWERAELQTLRPATETTERLLDPRVQVRTDILDGQGNVLTPAGTVINPLHMRAFTRRLIIVDPTRAAEAEWFDDLEAAPNLRDIVMITDLDRDSGWDGLIEAQERFGGDVYVLTRDVRSRFSIQATPTVVTSDGDQFVIREFAVRPTQQQSSEEQP